MYFLFKVLSLFLSLVAYGVSESFTDGTDQDQTVHNVLIIDSYRLLVMSNLQDLENFDFQWIPLSTLERGN